MFLNSDHDLFDFDLEVAAFIPSAPSCVPICSIADDMGETDNRRVRASLDRMRQRYGLQNLRCDGHHCVQSSKTRFGYLKHEAGRYLDIVYF